MADTPIIRTYDFPSDMTVRLIGTSDGTGESLALKVDRSLYSVNGGIVRGLSIRSIRWTMQGYQGIKLFWDHAADDLIAALSNNGYDEYPLGDRDPNTSADTVTGAIGDIILTTAGASNGATYDITLNLHKEG